MRVLVIGGRGFYGRRVVEVLSRLDGVRVEVGGRSGPVVINLRHPPSFSVLETYDCVVNASDAVTAPPDAAIVHVLQRGLLWFDLGADLAMVERVLALRVQGARGTVVLGVGSFPGLSTVLLEAVKNQVSTPLRLELGVRLSPLSGAGPGTVALMTEMLRLPRRWRSGGQSRTGKTAVGPGVSLPFPSGAHVAAQVGLPDVLLADREGRCAEVATYFAPTPGWMRFSFAGLAWLVAWAGPARSLVLAGIEAALLAVRGRLLRQRESPLELVAVANRGEADEASLGFEVRDGQGATAAFVAAALACYVAGDPGIYTVGERFELEALLAEAQRLAPEAGWCR